MRNMSPELQPKAVQYYCHMSSSVSHDQYTALPFEGVLVTWYGRLFYIYTFRCNFDTILCQVLETKTSNRCLIGVSQRLRFSGFSLYPLSFFLYSHFKECLEKNSGYMRRKMQDCLWNRIWRHHLSNPMCF